MGSIENVIQFHSKIAEKHNEEINAPAEETIVQYPTEEEIRVMNALIEQYTEKHPDDILPFTMWNGDCYHSVFEEMSRYAEEIGVDPWDAFALFVNKLHGWRMEKTEAGEVVVRFRKE